MVYIIYIIPLVTNIIQGVADWSLGQCDWGLTNEPQGGRY